MILRNSTLEEFAYTKVSELKWSRRRLKERCITFWATFSPPPPPPPPPPSDLKAPVWLDISLISRRFSQLTELNITAFQRTPCILDYAHGTTHHLLNLFLPKLINQVTGMKPLPRFKWDIDSTSHWRRWINIPRSPPPPPPPPQVSTACRRRLLWQNARAS